ncbi:MAG: 50S ribosomal protein L18 [Myxococcales bacterium]|nr:50S ribosomal protein L18 [Myxococcales bacterium]
MRKKVRNSVRGHWLGRKQRVGRRLSNSDRVRLTVFRSSKHIYAQLDDPISGKTLGTVSTRTSGVATDSSSGGVEAAKKVGEAIANLAKEKSIEEVVFNRNGFHYHGRIKALADAAREAGLRF